VRRRSPYAIGIGLAMILVPLIVAPASARSEHDRVVSYWTAERIASAKVRDFVRDGNRFVPRARPAPGGGVTGASWTGGGPVLDLTGKVYFTMAGGNWQCSGSVVSDGGRSGYSMVLTAGHCAIDETNGQFATNWMFMPNWDAQPATFATACTGSLYGCWTSAGGGGIYAHYGFATAGSFNDQAVTHDWALVVVGPGGKLGGQLDGSKSSGGVGGSYAIQFNLPGQPATVSAGNRLSAFGYPAAGKYKGKDLTWCAGSIGQDAFTDDLTWSMPCNMTGGSSGGPWFEGLNEANGSGGVLSSLNSYGYSGDNSMYGPKFNDDAHATYNAALTDSSVGNTVVGTSP
jgi:hypothetical protein